LTSKDGLDLRAGRISDDEFWARAKATLPEEYDVEVIRKEWYDGYILDIEIYNLLQNLQGKYRLVTFSGNVQSRVEYLDKKYNFRKFFDAEVYSYEYHYNKPSKEFTQAMVRATGVLPEEIIYIDDKEEYTTDASTMGIHVVIYKTGQTASLFEKLRSLGVDIL